MLYLSDATISCLAPMIQIIHADCRDILPTLGPAALVLTDPPYGIGKAEWDTMIPPEQWLPAARALGPVAVFAGVRGMWDYPRPDWTMCWARLASTQRNGKFRGFNNWEPIMIYGAERISNDTVSIQNRKGPKWHPTTKPVGLMEMILQRLKVAGGIVVDPFCGSGSVLKAADSLGLDAIGIEANRNYYEQLQEDLALMQVEAA